jgi:hypothetical protein
MLHCGHVTCSVFTREVSCVLGAGVGAEGWVLRCVGGLWGVVPAVVSECHG